MSAIGSYRGKRIVDLTLLAAVAIPAACAGIACAVAIKAADGGSVFFRQERIGTGGRPFQIWKFRTMTDAPDNPIFPDARRIIRPGKLLRRLSLDELPQLLNVARGEMSIVGPRPALRYQVERYDQRQRRRLLASPGITGLAQVRGRNRIDWSARIEHDLEYIERQSLLLDLRILAETVKAVLRGSGVEGHPSDDPLARPDPLNLPEGRRRDSTTMKGSTESAHQKAPLVIVGGGGHARVILDIFRSQQREPVGFIDPSPGPASARALAGLNRFRSFREARSSVGERDPIEFIAAIGNNRVRAKVYEEAVENGLQPALAIHPTAILLTGAHIAPGAQICAGTIIGVDARVGPNAIVNTGASVDHDGRIAEHASCAPGVLLAGNVTVGVGAQIGIGAIVREGMTIGRWSTVAAGAVVIRDVPAAGRVAGVPARPMAGDDPLS